VRICNKVSQLLTANQFELGAALSERQCLFIKHTARHDNSTRGCPCCYDPKKLPQRSFANPLIAIVLALDKPSLVVLSRDKVNPAVRAISAQGFDGIPSRNVVSRDQIFELAPRHCLDVTHGLMQFEQLEATTPEKGGSDRVRRRYI